MVITVDSIFAYSCGSGQSGYMAGTFQCSESQADNPIDHSPKDHASGSGPMDQEAPHTAVLASSSQNGAYGLRNFCYRSVEAISTGLLRGYCGDSTTGGTKRATLPGKSWYILPDICWIGESIQEQRINTWRCGLCGSTPKEQTLIRCTHPQMAVS